jgi:hypothetical protein
MAVFHPVEKLYPQPLGNPPKVPVQKGIYARRITRAKRHSAAAILFGNKWRFASFSTGLREQIETMQLFNLNGCKEFHETIR